MEKHSSIRRKTLRLAISAFSFMIALSGLAVPALGSSVTPGEWPQWRGPDRNGLSTEKGLLQEWPKGGPPLLWKVHGIGAGYSGITVAGGRLYTMGDLDGSSQVIALDPQGKVVWSTKVGKPGAPGWGGFAGPRASVTVDGDLVYAVDQWGEFVCLEAATGTERWRKSYEKDFNAPRPEWGFTESPLIDGERVVITPGSPQGTLAALDKKSGKVLWQSTDFTEPAQYGSVLPARIGGAPQYIQLTMESLVGISPTDGKVLWKTKRKGQTAVIPDPIIAGDLIYVTSGYGVGCNLFKVTGQDGKFKAEQVYSSKEMQNHHGGVVNVKDHIYGHSDANG
jgi:outer membrane protein assembly factor BamB